jgi:hypothetical protein
MRRCCRVMAEEGGGWRGIPDEGATLRHGRRGGGATIGEEGATWSHGHMVC